MVNPPGTGSEFLPCALKSYIVTESINIISILKFVAKKGKSRKGIAAAIAAIAIIVVVLVVFVFPLPPHFGFVSEKSANSVTGGNFTTTKNTSSSSSTPSSNGVVSEEFVQYTGSGGALSISVEKYSNTSLASSAYAKAQSGLGFITASLAANGSGSYRGFSYFFLHAAIFSNTLVLAVGHDGKYVFLIESGLKVSITSSQISSLVKDQINAMIMV